MELRMRRDGADHAAPRQTWTQASTRWRSDARCFRRWFMPRRAAFCICLLVALTLELVGFNHLAWSTWNRTPITNPEVMVDGQTLEYGKSYILHESRDVWRKASMTLFIYPDARHDYVDVRSLDIDVQSLGTTVLGTDECGFTESIEIYDEGHSLGYSPNTSTGETSLGRNKYPETLTNATQSPRVVCSAVPGGAYRPIYATGKVKELVVTLSGPYFQASVQSITLNSQVPLRINGWRLLAMTLASFGIACFFTRKESDIRALTRESSATPQVTDDSPGLGMTAIHRREWLAAIIALCIACTIVQNKIVSWGPQGYQSLATALLRGTVSVSDGSAQLAALANPYDPSARSTLPTGSGWASTAPYMFDYAYYGGKYYVYFGIVPCLLFYLPYRAAIGVDLSDITVCVWLNIALIIGTFLLMNELRRRYCPRLPWSLQMLASVTMSLSTAICLSLKSATTYGVSITTGIALSLLGLAAWMSSARAANGFDASWGLLGSLLMALAVGCRPQMAFLSFFIFPIFSKQLHERQSNKRLALLLIPYVPVACGIMWYNAIRFGSPLEFGARYQLAGQDLVSQPWEPARIPIGLWYYLLAPMSLIPEFPFLLVQDVTTSYTGELAHGTQVGGILWLMPILLIMLAPRVWRAAPRTRWWRIIAFTITIVDVIADTIAGGIIMRYQLDFRLALAAAAMATLCEWMGSFHATPASERIPGSVNAPDASDAIGEANAQCKDALAAYRVIGALCMLTLVTTALVFFSQWEGYDMASTHANTGFYVQMRQFFDIWQL